MGKADNVVNLTVAREDHGADGAMIGHEAEQAIVRMGQALSGLADMMRSTNERMGALEQQVRLLTKVTPMQAGEINGAVRARAADLCSAHKMAGKEQAVAAAIRRVLRLSYGVQSVRDLPRCEYQVALQQAQIWDDYKAMKKIRGREAQRADT